MRELANAAYITYGYVRALEVGAKGAPSVDVIEKLARALGVEMSALLEDAVYPDPQRYAVRIIEEAVEAVQGVAVPVVGRVPADTLRLTELGEHKGRVVHVSAEQLAGARKPFAVEVSGDCLRAIGIFDGDIVICDHAQGRRPNDGELTLVRVNDEYTLKRWREVGGDIELHDGHGQIVHVLSQGDEVEVVGFYVTFIPGKR